MIAEYGSEQCPIDILWSISPALLTRFVVNSAGKLQIIIKDIITTVEEVTLQPLFLDKYYNYGRNAAKINIKGLHIVFIDSNRDIYLLKLKAIKSTGMMQASLKLSSLVAKSNTKCYKVYRLEGANYKADTLCTDARHIYSLTTNGTIVKASLSSQSADSITTDGICTHQLHEASFNFTCVNIHLNMLVVGGHSTHTNKAILALLDAGLDLKHVAIFDSQAPCHAMHIGMHGHMPVLTVLTADMAVRVYMIIGGRFVDLPCKFDSLRSLNEFYQERSPLSFSSPFLRGPRLLAEENEQNVFGAR